MEFKKIIEKYILGGSVHYRSKMYAVVGASKNEKKCDLQMLSQRAFVFGGNIDSLTD